MTRKANIVVSFYRFRNDRHQQYNYKITFFFLESKFRVTTAVSNFHFLSLSL